MRVACRTSSLPFPRGSPARPRTAMREAPSAALRKTSRGGATRQRSTRLVVVAVGSLLSVTCAIPLGRPRMSAGPTVDPSAEKRRPANEVLLTVRGEPPVRGKLVGIDGEDVTFLPTPYWNLAPRKVKVGDIAAIEITDMGRAKGRSAGYSFAAAFVLVGAICAAGSKYDEDYKDCLLGSAAVGGVASLVGFAVGAGVDRAHPRSYRFEAMKPEEKRKAIQGLVAR